MGPPGPPPGDRRTFEAANIQVLRVHDGLIVESRDHHDHLALIVGGDGRSELVTALDGKQRA
ncbi:hypothetical protein [Streptomyces sp. 5112.2]|uniref:hypothetical protein n=1 Tax=Streptomyces sp. 5112.2 TaxID=1938848 RepID=UPI000B80A409|nr:hypothetical protein [Streptomyces sp. 5112.2]